MTAPDPEQSTLGCQLIGEAYAATRLRQSPRWLAECDERFEQVRQMEKQAAQHSEAPSLCKVQ
jgi:hypothetical protein